MAFCTGCGNQLAEGERFCPACGADQLAPPPAPAAEQPALPPEMPPPSSLPPAMPGQYPPPAAGSPNRNKIWWVVIGVAALWALYHFLTPPPQQPSGQMNLIFVVSDDLAYQSSGDVNPNTANLTSQGLQRSLLLGTYLEQLVQSTNVNGIYVLIPMTHPQTANNDPDLVSAETVEQFAALTPVTMSTMYPDYGSPYSVGGFPLNSSPPNSCANCQGLDFADQGGDNEALVSGILAKRVPGSYVFSAPWETTSRLLAGINQQQGYNLALPTSYQGANTIYVLSITQSGSATFTAYNTNANPASTYPSLSQVPTGACNQQPPFNIAVTGGAGGAQIPAGTNTNETVYLVRHAEAHPVGSFDDGNYVAAGQWRALDLPYALQGRIRPSIVYAIDPDTPIQGTQSSWGASTWSYVRPALTVEPYAIANNLPFQLAEGFAWNSGPASSSFFFTGGRLSNTTALVGWEHGAIPVMVNALIASYFPQGGAPQAPGWPDNDYDTVWTVTLDAQGNLSINNSLCEGINSAALPTAAPQF
jgi:hypothetical protein